MTCWFRNGCLQVPLIWRVAYSTFLPFFRTCALKSPFAILSNHTKAAVNRTIVLPPTRGEGTLATPSHRTVRIHYHLLVCFGRRLYISAYLGPLRPHLRAHQRLLPETTDASQQRSLPPFSARGWLRHPWPGSGSRTSSDSRPGF